MKYIQKLVVPMVLIGLVSILSMGCTEIVESSEKRGDVIFDEGVPGSGTRAHGESTQEPTMMQTPRPTLKPTQRPTSIPAYSNGVNIIVGIEQTIRCGDGCNIDCGYGCNIICGDGCNIDCGDDCVITCGRGCNIFHGERCIITHDVGCNIFLLYPD